MNVRCDGFKHYDCDNLCVEIKQRTTTNSRSTDKARSLLWNNPFYILNLECHKLRITTSNGNKDNVTWDNLFCTKVGGVNIPENMLFICPLRQLVICVTHFTDRKTFWLSLSDKKITSSPWLRPLLAMMDNFLSLIILHLLFSYSGEWGIRCSSCICKF